MNFFVHLDLTELELFFFYCPTRREICLGLNTHAAATYKRKRHSPTVTIQKKKSKKNNYITSLNIGYKNQQNQNLNNNNNKKYLLPDILHYLVIIV